MRLKTRLGERIGSPTARFLPIVAILILFAILTLPLSCGEKKGGEIKIGVILPLTGDAASYGNSLKKGVEVAQANINAQGGVHGSTVEVMFEDSRAKPTAAIASYRRLTDAVGVRAIIGGMFSHTTLAIAPIAQKEGIVLLSPTASSTEVPNTGGKIFTIYPSDDLDGEFVAQFASTELEAQTAAVVGANADAMLRAAKSFVERFEALGGDVVLEETFEPQNSDFRTLLAKANNLNPDVLFIPGLLEEVVLLVRQAKEMGVKAQMISISTTYDEKLFDLLEEAASGLMLSAPFYDVSARDTLIVGFVSRYNSRFGKNPDVWAAYGFDALNILTEGLRQTSDVKPLDLALIELGPFYGATGQTEFNSNGSVTKELRMKVVKNRQFEDYTR